MASIRSIRSFRMPLRSVALGAALMLPALLYAALALAMPLQYRVVLEDASARGWPFAWALLILAAYAICAFLALRARDRLSPGFAMLASAPAVAALVTGLLVRPALAVVLSGALVAVLLLLVFILARGAAWNRMPRPLQSVWLGAGAALAVYLAFAWATSADPVELPRRLSAFAILAIFAGALGVLACAIVLKPKAGAALLIYSIIAILFFGPNDHRVPPAPAKAAPRDMDAMFGAWARSRRDLDAYRERNLPYPVIFVSSEGGGIYAAAHAYSVLSQLARHCPTFTQHVFATVGVSGGALGNALFAGAADPAQKPHAPCRPTRGALDPTPVVTDHLSPVLARFLLVEPLDRLVPGRWMRRDRAQILTDSFLSAARGKDHLRAAISDSFDPGGARPALLSVAVNVANGRRLVVSPFHPSNFGGTALWWPGGESFAFSGRGKSEISVLDAAGLSARFPWITPTGRLAVTDANELILADGGYFENSGADTVSDLINDRRMGQNWDDYMSEQIRRHGEADAEAEFDGPCPERRVKVVKNFHMATPWGNCDLPVFLIHFAIASREPEPPPGELPLAPRQSFLFDPMSALFATRESRAEIALQRADLDRCGTALSGAECTSEPGSSLGFFRNDIAPLSWNLPLGWFMTRQSLDMMIERTAPEALFDYRRRPKEIINNDIQFVVIHLDPDLHREGASPSYSDFLGAP